MTLNTAALAEFRTDLAGSRYSLTDDGELYKVALKPLNAEAAKPQRTDIAVSVKRLRGTDRVQFRSVEFGDLIASYVYTTDAVRRFIRAYYLDKDM